MLTLQILHASDFEGGVDAIDDAPAFAALVDFFETEAETAGIASILLSAGDGYIPGPFFNAAALPELAADLQAAVEAFYGLEAGTLSGIEPGAGFIDITIANILGVDASAIGNHEFDAGPATLANIIGARIGEVEPEVEAMLADIAWLGAQFPYLSANLDFANEPALLDVFTSEILTSDAFAQTPAELLADGPTPQIAASTIVEVPGEGDAVERIGVVGATTQLLASISSEGNVEVLAGGSNDMAALAAVLQPEIDALAAEGVNKIVLVSHLQQFALEQELAGLLSGVDVIIAGGSDTIVADEDDPLRPGDEADVTPYPFETTDADGNPLVIVSTDGQYSYVGRLVVTFDEDGIVQLDSIDAAQSGAFATDEPNVVAVTGAESLDAAVAASGKASAVDQIAGAVQSVVDELAATAPGFSTVYLDGRRGQVRTEETNLGNLTADANIFKARQFDDAVQVSIKNGGGIRDDIGDIVQDGLGGSTLEPPFNNAVSELDIQNTLRFDNELTLLTLSSEGLLAVLEHGVSASGGGNTPGQFPQVGGVSFSFDLDRNPGDRVRDVFLLEDDGSTGQQIVADGRVVDGAPETIRIVTLSFLADGGDSYPFVELGTDRVDVTEDGEPVGEQQALSEYLAAEFGTPETAFDDAETPAEEDGRIVNLDAQGIDTLPDFPAPTGELAFERITQYDSGVGEGGSEVVSVDDGLGYVTNGAQDRIDVFDLLTGELVSSLDLSGFDNYGGLNSVAASGGLVAVAIEADQDEGGEPENGFVALYQRNEEGGYDFLETVEAGNLPDMVTFSADGSTIFVANEGEFNGDSVSASDPAGGITVIDVGDLSDVSATTIGFDGVEIPDDVRILGDDPVTDLEPEYITLSGDGSTAYVSLQENNAIGVFDVASRTWTGVFSLGRKDFSDPANAFDPLDDDRIDIINGPAFGLYMPDAIASFESGGETFIVTANEGDDRGDFDPDGAFGDAGRVRDFDLDPEAFSEEEAALVADQFGRLTISVPDSDTDGDGDLDALVAYGGRSFTIFDTEGNVVFDSGSEFERIVANLNTSGFNSDDGPGGEENRSDNKGPEPEAVAVGTIGGQTYAFIGLERDGGVMVYNVTDPANSTFVEYLPGFGNGDVSPEVIEFVSASESPTGEALLAVSYEVSGTTAVYEIDRMGTITAPENVQDVALLYEAALNRPADVPGLNFWIGVNEGGLALGEISQFFVDAPEFAENFDVTTDEGFIGTLYQNVLEREADDAGQTFWNGVVDDIGRSETLLFFARSDENRDNAGLDDLVLVDGDWTFV